MKTGVKKYQRIKYEKTIRNHRNHCHSFWYWIDGKGGRKL